MRATIVSGSARPKSGLFDDFVSDLTSAGQNLISSATTTVTDTVEEYAAPVVDVVSTMTTDTLDTSTAAERSVCPEVMPLGEYDASTGLYVLPSLTAAGVYDPNCVYDTALTIEQIKEMQEYYQGMTGTQYPNNDGVWGMKTQQAFLTIGDPFGYIIPLEVSQTEEISTESTTINNGGLLKWVMIAAALGLI